MTIYEEADELAKLPQPIKIAGYLKVLAENTEIGARLRTSKKDEDWSEEEKAEWEASCEKMEPYWFSLTEADLKALNPIITFTGILCRGENV